GFVNAPGLDGIDIDGNNLASGIVKLKYVNGGSFSNFSFHDWASTTEAGIFITHASTSAVGTCGNGGGGTMFNTGYVQSYRGTGTNGIKLGDPSISATDVCSFKFSNIFVDINNPPGNHGIWLANSDSDQFSNMSVSGFTGSSISSITATSATT